MTTLVPTIDLSQWHRGERDQLGTQLDQACRQVGFFQVVGHGMADDVVAAMRSATHAFFDLPLAAKQQYIPTDPSVNRGYAAKGGEALAYSVGITRPPDLFEAFNIGPDQVDESDPMVAAERHRLFAANLWPHETPELRPALVNYMAAARSVADVLMAAFRSGVAAARRVLLVVHDALHRHVPRHPLRDAARRSRSAATVRSAWASTPTTACAPCCSPTPCRACRSSAPTVGGTTSFLHRVRCS